MSAEKMTKEEAYLRLQLWYTSKNKLKEEKSAEHLERMALAKFYFPKPSEGTNRLDLGGGYDLKVGVSYSYKVDEAAVEQVTQRQIKQLKLPWEDLIVYKPTLDKKVYNDLTPEQQKFVDGLLDITEGRWSMDIVPNADREGQAAHIAAATGVPHPPVAAAPALTVVIDPATAQPGFYYCDGEHWWVLKGNYEWDWVDPAKADDVISVATVERNKLLGVEEEEEPAPRRRGRTAKKAAAVKKTTTRKRSAK